MKPYGYREIKNLKLSVIKYNSQRTDGGRRTSDGWESKVHEYNYITVYSDCEFVYKSTLSIIQSFIEKNYRNDSDYGYGGNCEYEEFSQELTHELAVLLIDGVDEIESIEEVDIYSNGKDMLEDVILMPTMSINFYKIPSKDIEVITDQRYEYIELQKEYDQKRLDAEKKFRIKVIEKTRSCCINNKNPLLEDLYPLDFVYNIKDEELFDKLINIGAKNVKQLFSILLWQYRLGKTSNIIYFYNQCQELFTEQILLRLMKEAILSKNGELESFLSNKINLQNEIKIDENSESIYCELAIHNEKYFCSLLEKGIISIYDDKLLGKIISNKYLGITDFLLANEQYMSKCRFLNNKDVSMLLMRKAILTKNYPFVTYLSSKIDYSKNYRFICYPKHKVEEIALTQTDNGILFASSASGTDEFDAISLACFIGDAKTIDILLNAGADIHKSNYLSYLIRIGYLRISMSHDNEPTNNVEANAEIRDACACYLLERGIDFEYSNSNIHNVINIKYILLLNKILRDDNLPKIYEYRHNVFNRLVCDGYLEYAERLLFAYPDSYNVYIDSLRNTKICGEIIDWLIKYRNINIDIKSFAPSVISYRLAELIREIEPKKMCPIINRGLQISNEFHWNSICDMVANFNDDIYKSIENALIEMYINVPPIDIHKFFMLLSSSNIFSSSYFEMAQKLLLTDNMFKDYKYDQECHYRTEGRIETYNWIVNNICEDAQKLLAKTDKINISEDERNIIYNLCQKALNDNQANKTIKYEKKEQKTAQRFEEYDDYSQSELDDMYRDAFDGNEDAYWNID
ncbi:hypothetical protein EZS27_019750 [termite gut metagenome]|uniref:Ankyrin repeat protein n=1 Tax=termite gut metagenome TaxID=433724 RepID=A0A5J4RCA7_9ZZZZ